MQFGIRLEEVRRKQLKKEEKRKVAPVVKNRKDLVVSSSVWLDI